MSCNIKKWEKIDQYFSEKNLAKIANLSNDLTKMLVMYNYLCSNIHTSKFLIEVFIDFIRKEYFTLKDLHNLNFSNEFIDNLSIMKYFSEEEVNMISKMPWDEGKAVTIIGRVYAECLDKSKNPVAGHSVRISKCLESEEEKIVALLHDVVEDGYLTFNNLRQFGFSKPILETLKILTRDKSKYQNYGDYINSILESKNLTALKIKFWDMQDNQSPYRVKDLDEVKKEKATHKYRPFIPLVVLAIKEIEEEQKLERKLNHNV